MTEHEYWTEVPGWLHNKLCNAFPSPEDVEDIEQDILLHIWRNRGKFNHRSSFATWAHAVTKNRIADFYRREIRREKKEMAYAVYDRERRREQEKMRLQAHLSAMEITSGLPISYRDVLKLRLEGNSFAEIADELGLTYEAARSRYRRAIKHIQRSLDS